MMNDEFEFEKCKNRRFLHPSSVLITYYFFLITSYFFLIPYYFLLLTFTTTAVTI